MTPLTLPGIVRKSPNSVLAVTAFVALAPFALAACTTPVAVALDETEANRVVVALDHARVDATKEVDPTSEGKFRVVVPRDDAARALASMHDEDVPRAHAPGVLEALGKGGLVPSDVAEHAQLVSGTSGELSRTLESVDGVLAARVHLNVPRKNALHDSFRDRGADKATASVLVEHRGTTAPLTVEAIQRIVAGAVAGLAASDVAVVMVPKSDSGGRARAELGHVGPIAVASSSVRALQGTLAVLVVLVATLSFAVLALYGRLSRRQERARDPG
ncbi:MAG: hypothetical protein U0169_20470 [Polyangiaceae bacterium]